MFEIKSTTKKPNIYKVTTTTAPADGTTNVQTSVDYVRAKTRAGAIGIVADKRIQCEIATQEDLLALAKIAVLGEK